MLPLLAVVGALSPGGDDRPERLSLGTAYLRALESAGGAPAVLSPGASQAAVEAILCAASGLMLTGGGDVDPARYGESNRASVGVSGARDATEASTIDLALARGMPVLAICRGMQMLNVAQGGSLWQDLAAERPSDLSIEHRQDAARTQTTHSVRIAGGTRLASAVGSRALQTNSMHHQGIRRLGTGLEATAWTDDGLVEGVEMPARPFVVGVQWHPEELTGSEAHAPRLFTAFIQAANAYDRPTFVGGASAATPAS